MIQGTTIHGTIQNVPLPPSPVLEANVVVTPDGAINECDTTPKYTVLLDDNTSHDLTYHDLLSSSTATPVDPSAPDTIWAGIPSCYLHKDAKITLDHDRVYHKGNLNYSLTTGFEFVARRNLCSKKVDFTVPLPNFAKTGPRY